METTLIENLEMAITAKELIKKYYAMLGHVDLSLVYFCTRSGEKPKKGKSKTYEMSGIRSQWVKNLLSQGGINQRKLYCLCAWDDEWQRISPLQKQWIIFECLYAVGPESDGNLRKRDVSDFTPILTAMMDYGVGPDWRNVKELPDLLGNDLIHFIVPNDNLNDDDDSL